MKTRTDRQSTAGIGLVGGSRWGVLGVSTMLLLAHACMLCAATGTLDHGSGWYPAGTNLMVTATPIDVYSRFDHWSGDTNGMVLASDTLTMANLSGPKDITAVFLDSTTASNAVPYTWLHTLSNDWTTAGEFEAGATNDYDGDGFTTAQEYWSGTDPFSDSSYLRIAGVEFANGNVRLRWNHARVDTNIPPLCVQVCTDLNIGNWQDVAAANTNMPVEGQNTWEEPYTGSLFYRLRVTTVP